MANTALFPYCSKLTLRSRTGTSALTLLVLMSCLFGMSQVALGQTSEGETRDINNWLKGIATERLDGDGMPLERRLVGIYLDRRELDTQMILWQPDQLWLPLEPLIIDLDLVINRDGGLLVLTTPGGDVKINPAELIIYQGRLYISTRTLEKSLQVDAQFDPSRYAVVLHLPWWDGTNTTVTDTGTNTEPDFAPPDFSVSQLRLDQTVNGGENLSTKYFTEMIGSGRLLDGVWRVEMDKTPGSDITPREYYWITTRDQSQWLIGKQSSSAHPLLPGAEFTGVQSAWSNEVFAEDYFQDISRNDFTRSLGIPVQDFFGEAEPGSIAELLVDGRTVQFTRVRLDGTYQFLQVELPSRQFNRVVVRIRRSTSGATIEEQDFSGVNSQLMLSKGRHLLYGGMGVRGNPLSTLYDDSKAAGLAQWRYGLTEGFTVETLLQSLNDQDYLLVGATATLGENWLVSGSVSSNDPGDHAYLWETTGFGNRWNLRHLSREYETGFRDNEARETLHEIDFRHQVLDNAQWGLVGRREITQERDIEFVRPGGRINIGRATTINAWPNFTGDYRVDVRSGLGNAGQVTYSYEDENQELDFRRFFGNNSTFYATATRFPERQGRLESGVQWLPNDGDNRSRLLAAGIVNDDSRAGFLVQWDWLLLPGLFSRLEVRDEPSGNPELTDGLRVNWTLTVDLAFSGWRPRPGDSSRRFNRAGSIAGKLQMDNNLPTSGEAIKKVTLLLDGYTHSSPVEGNYFHLNYLRPGTYRMKLDAEHLPLEVVPEDRSYTVKVASGGVTTVELGVHLEFSAAGRVLDVSGNPVPAARIQISGPESLRRIVYSDRFGLYRVDQLPPGEYVATVLSIDERALADPTDRPFRIRNDFLFGVDLQLTAEASAEPGTKTETGAATNADGVR